MSVSNVAEVEVEESAEVGSSTGRGVVFAVASATGGAGKTTTALCVASSIAHASRRAVEEGLRDAPLSVCVVDLDVRDGQVGFLLQQSSPTVLNLFIESSVEGWPLDEMTLRKSLVRSENLGVSALLAPKRARTADQLEPEFYQKVIGRLRDLFDVVVVDTATSSVDAVARKVAFPSADRILFITNLSAYSVHGFARWFDENALPVSEGGAGVTADKVVVVKNQHSDSLGFSDEEVRSVAGGVDGVVAVPLDSTGVVSASNENRLHEVVLDGSTLSSAYFQIACQVLPDEVLVPPMGHGNA